MVQFELQLDRVGLEVDKAPGCGEFRRRLSAAVEVDQKLGRPVEP